MAALLFIPVVLAAALSQVVVSQFGPLSGLKPDFVLVMVATAGLLLSFRQAVVLAILGGLLLDLFSGMPFGFITLVLILIVVLVRLPSRDLVEVNPLVCMVIIALSTGVYYSLFALAITAMGGEPDWLYLPTSVILPSVVMNSLLSPFAFLLYRLVGRRALKVREDWR